MQTVLISDRLCKHILPIIAPCLQFKPMCSTLYVTLEDRFSFLTTRCQRWEPPNGIENGSPKSEAGLSTTNFTPHYI